jgi:guanosine-3',5'-bis(diphosphate) 3'-pyrophosphohydrolase
MNYDELYKEARLVAQVAHSGQIYDIYPYSKHLEDTVNVIKRFGYAGDYIIAAYLHDSIEDGNLTYNKIKKAFGENVAELVLAVTDPSDIRSRKEKKDRVYQKILSYPNSLIIKLADRIANVEHATRFANTQKLKMYKEEYAEFKDKLTIGSFCNPMWNHLDTLLS